ncbi:MAG: S41 family peptidase [Clostridia bacterium]|nr:S41 family peptidase [Clostridia bacterium]
MSFGSKARTVLISALSGAAAAALAINLFYGGTRLTRSEYEQLQKTMAVTETLQYAQETFYGELPSEEDLVTAAARGMTAELDDPYAWYYTAEEYDEYMKDLSGEYVGIGVTITLAETGGAEIVSVNSGGPADKAGVQIGDILVAVEDEDVTSCALTEITERVLGKEGETVSLTFLRGAERLTFDIVRERQVTHRIHHEMLGENIGCIRIDRFSGDCEEGFKTALSELKESGMKALVIDVRDNPGGTLDTVVAVADLLLPKGVIVTVKSGTGEEDVYRSDAECLALPIAILTNGNSASASELLAGALQDSGAGIVVGENTYGKGVVQTTWNLPRSGSWFKLTTAAYYTPNDRNIDGEGIAPDVEVHLPEEWQGIPAASIPREADTQLSAALEALKADLNK